MLNRILDISLKNRIIVLLCAVILSAIGLFTIRSMEIDVFPDLTAPTVTILTESHGMEAEEVERLVTFQIETGLNGSPNVRRIRSSSAAGISIVWVEFEWGTDIFRARQIVSEKIPMITEKLPIGIGEPTLAPVSSIMGEVMLLSISSDSLSPMEVRSMADWDILPRLKSINGIANVIVIGGEFKQYQILASPDKMDYYGVTLQELENAAANSNVNSSGGFYSEHGNHYVVKGEGRITQIEDILAAVIKLKNDAPITIGDVAEVKIGPSDKIGDASMNGKDAVILTITKQPQTNTLALTERIDATIEDIVKGLPHQLQIRTDIFRQASFIEASVNNLESTLLEGAFFVMLVLLLFLMNWRTTVISLIAIPLSLLVTFIVLKLMGYSINTMSLGGMAIAVGALVDDAIIDVENVFKRLRENRLKNEEDRKPTLQVVYAASKEIRNSILVATLIIIVSFVPLFFLSGMEGKLLQPLGVAFITAVLTSLFVAVTVTPVLCSYLLTNEKLLANQANGTKVEAWLNKNYKSVLAFFLRYPKSTILSTIVVFSISFMLAFGLGRSFLPEFNEGSLVISLVGPPSMSIDESNKMGRLAEKTLMEIPEVQVVSRRTGRAESDEHAQGINASEIDVPFILEKRSKEEFLKDVRERLAVLPGMSVTVGMPIAHRIDHMLSGTRANIAIKVFGTDLNELFKTCNSIKEEITSVNGVVDINVEQQIEVPKVKITPRRQLLKNYGLSVGELMDKIDVAFGGEVVSEVLEEHRRFDMVLRYQPTSRTSISQLKSALMDVPSGGMVALDQLAMVESKNGPHTINKENVERKVVVSANISQRDLRGAVNEIKTVINNSVAIPEGYHVEYGGQFESEEKASKLLFWSSILAILVILGLLYVEFKGFKLAGIVLLNLPMALIGGILIVYFTTGIVSIASTIGFISLFGIATRNGILLVSRYQSLTKLDSDKDQTIVKAAIDRLNPILMTALTTALALIPLALKGGEAGNEIQSPMSVVILGGLVSATLLNLIVIPCVLKLAK